MRKRERNLTHVEGRETAKDKQGTSDSKKLKNTHKIMSLTLGKHFFISIFYIWNPVFDV